MNTKLLLQVQNAIKEDPRRLNMKFWGKPTSPKNLDAPACGTVACIGGWTVLSAKRRPGEPFSDALCALREGDYGSIYTNATKLLNISSASANRLFYVANWPLKFRRAYNEATLPFDRVRATVDRIDYFIKTKGK